MGDFDDWKERYLGYVDTIIGFIPYKRVEQWKEFGLNPLSKVSKPDSIMERVKDIYVMLALNTVLGILASLPAIVIWGAFALLYSIMLFGIPLIFLGMALVAWLVLLALSPVFTLLYCLLEYAVAKLLGGAGDYRTHFNASAASGLAAFALGLPLSVLLIPFSFIPCIGFFAIMPIRIGQAALAFYGLYLKFTSFRKLHDLSDGRAAAVVIVPMVLLAMAAIGLAVMFYLGMFAFMFSLPVALGAAAGAGGAAPS